MAGVSPSVRLNHLGFGSILVLKVFDFELIQDILEALMSDWLLVNGLQKMLDPELPVNLGFNSNPLAVILDCNLIVLEHRVALELVAFIRIVHVAQVVQILEELLQIGAFLGFELHVDNGLLVLIDGLGLDVLPGQDLVRDQFLGLNQLAMSQLLQPLLRLSNNLVEFNPPLLVDLGPGLHECRPGLSLVTLVPWEVLHHQLLVLAIFPQLLQPISHDRLQFGLPVVNETVQELESFISRQRHIIIIVKITSKVIILISADHGPIIIVISDLGYGDLPGPGRLVNEVGQIGLDGLGQVLKHVVVVDYVACTHLDKTNDRAELIKCEETVLRIDLGKCIEYAYEYTLSAQRCSGFLRMLFLFSLFRNDWSNVLVHTFLSRIGKNKRSKTWQVSVPLPSDRTMYYADIGSFSLKREVYFPLVVFCAEKRGPDPSYSRRERESSSARRRSPDIFSICPFLSVRKMCVARSTKG